MTELPGRLADLVAGVAPADAAVARHVAERWDALAKPPGSLGRLEHAVTRLAAAQGTATPHADRPALLVCAADHGVHAQGVTPWPQAITTAMATAIAGGRAATSAMAAAAGIGVTVLDVGIADPPPPGPRLRAARVRAGTADLSQGPAMSPDEAVAAVLAGADAAAEVLADGTDLLLLGDMGIANTTASAALVSALTGVAAAEVVGPGAGADAAAVRRKAAIIGAAVARIPPQAGAVEVLARVGGLEHAALVGAVLAAAAARVPVVLDGVITDAAALVAARLAPAVVDHLTAGHRSAEPGARAALDVLGLDPLLDLDLRLGEGSGAVLATGVLRAGIAALTGAARIADLGG